MLSVAWIEWVSLRAVLLRKPLCGATNEKQKSAKTDEFSENFQTVFDTSPFFRNKILQFFGDTLTFARFGKYSQII